jgi:hypothetical protein
VERVGDAHLLSDRAHRHVGGGGPRVGGDAEHPLRLVVPGGQLVAPVGDPPPLRVGVERVERPVQGVGVDQRAAAHPRTGEHQHVAEQVDPLDAEGAQRGGPEERAHLHRVLGELVVGEAPAGLQDGDRVTLLDQPQGGDAAAEAGADDHDVDVVHAAPTSLLPAGKQFPQYLGETSILHCE